MISRVGQIRFLVEPSRPTTDSNLLAVPVALNKTTTSVDAGADKHANRWLGVA